MLKAKGFSKATGKKLRRRVRWMRRGEGLKLNGGRRTVDLLFPYSHHKRLQSPPRSKAFALSPVASSALLTMRRMEGGVCFNFGADNQFNMFFYKAVGGDALESLDDLRCRA